MGVWCGCGVPDIGCLLAGKRVVMEYSSLMGNGADIDRETVYQEPVSDAAHLLQGEADGWSVQMNGVETHVKPF